MPKYQPYIYVNPDGQLIVKVRCFWYAIITGLDDPLETNNINSIAWKGIATRKSK